MNKNCNFRTKLYEECVTAAEFADRAVMMAYSALVSQSDEVFRSLMDSAECACKAAVKCSAVLFECGLLLEEDWAIMEDIDNVVCALDGLHNLYDEIVEDETMEVA